VRRARLFERDVAWRVCGPDELVPAAPRLLTFDLAANTCFVFADHGGASTDEHVVVELQPARAGRFYEAFWDRYGITGDMPVIARSVADALRWLLDTDGGRPDKAFERRPVLGDAFD
jgi:hypothetical protein